MSADPTAVTGYLLAHEQLAVSEAEVNALAATLESMRRLGAMFDRTMRNQDEIGPELRAVPPSVEPA